MASNDPVSENITDTLPDKESIRLVILGKTGNGKSSVSNSVTESQDFKSELSLESITKECQYEVAECYGDIRLEIVDTPGLFDTGTPLEESIKEITKCIGLSAPGPHAFVLVLDINRFTKEEEQTVDALSQLFGDKFFYYVVVLFTGKDALIRDGKSLEDFITKVPDYLRKLLVKCKNRFTAIDNTGTQEKRQAGVHELLTVIQNMKEENEPEYYTNKLFKEAEKILLSREREFALELKTKEVDQMNLPKKRCDQFGATRQDQEAAHTEIMTRKKRREIGGLRHNLKKEIVGGAEWFVTNYRPVLEIVSESLKLIDMGIKIYQGRW
ncbi:GTPase IMAP family member 7-like isoform X2 [Patella vulgata]|uniref:GTPase IMAP family member 7-like isoform X2 n=1 Tax=Patella vulgata TaxID=6465 RepID=UPI00218008A2|nr:GTPase IMAP family member 7-like isoform X2 [Patella vulgata]